MMKVTQRRGMTRNPPGPASLLLKSPHFYHVIVNVALTKGTNQLQVEAKVIRPDGIQHGSKYLDTVSGGTEPSR
jgi:hypothetical protein